MNLPNENRSYINHDDKKSINTKSGGTWSYGNQYEIEDLMVVMKNMHIISYVPYITHPNVTTSVHIQTSTIGILVRPKRKNHFIVSSHHPLQTNEHGLCMIHLFVTWIQSKRIFSCNL